MRREGTPRASRSLQRRIRRSLASLACPANAAAMQSYMKSEMPFLGVKAPDWRSASRTAFKALPLEDAGTWEDTVLALWREARHREERYAAIELTGFRAYRDYQRMSILPMYEEMVVTGAWWDLVDPIATQRLEHLLRRSRRGMAARMRAWSRSGDIWKRRSAILCQIKSKGDTDPELLFDCIHPSMTDREFFLRKAIGWALREHAKTDARSVVAFVEEHRDTLSPLSRREALRNL